MPKSKKPLWKGEITCPYCGKDGVEIVVHKRTTAPAQPAKFKIDVVVNKALKQEKF